MLAKMNKDEASVKMYNRVRDHRCSLQRIEATNLRKALGLVQWKISTCMRTFYK